jgi:hypothetical protein
MDEIGVYLRGGEMGIMDHKWLVGPRMGFQAVRHYPLNMSAKLLLRAWEEDRIPS